MDQTEQKKQVKKSFADQATLLAHVQNAQKNNIQSPEDTAASEGLLKFHQEFDAKMGEVFKQPEEAVVLSTDAQMMAESHKEEYTSRLKKSHFFKKDEYEMVPVTKDKEAITENKKKTSALIDKNVNEVKDQMVKMQDDVDINVAKKTDFATVRSLSAFALDMKDVSEFNELVKSYTGGANPTDEEILTSRFATMSKLTEKIMSYQPGDFDVSTIQKIADSSKQFEIMSTQLDAYKELLKSNEAYKKVLENQKDETGQSYLERVQERLHSLGQISRYYRVQKLIYEDSIYQNARNNEIPMEIKDTDDFQTKRLKKLLRISYYMGRNLGAADLPDLAAESTLSKNADSYAKKFDKETLRGAKVDAEKKLSTGLRIAENFGEQKKQEEIAKHKKLYSERLSKAIKDQTANDDALDKEIIALEYEKLMVVPEFLKLKLVTGSRNDDPNMTLMGNKKGNNECCDIAVDVFGKQKLIGDIRAYRDANCKNKTLSVAKMPEAETFNGNLDYADTFDRMLHCLTNVCSYKQNDNEILQIVKHMAIVNTKDYKKNIEDPEVKLYYESRFKESAIKFYGLFNAALMRLARGMGDKIFLLHPKDCIMQTNLQMRQYTQAIATFTNFCSDKNGEEIKKFIRSNNKSGKYPFDVDKLFMVGTTFANATMKSNLWIERVTTDILSDEYQIFPKGIREEIMKWWNGSEYAKKEKFNGLNDKIIMYWLGANYKEELASGKFFDRVDKEGKPIFEKNFAVTELTFFTMNLRPVQQYLDSDLYEHTTPEELAEYEKQLKKGNYTACGPLNDPYNLEQFKKKYHDFMYDKQNNYFEGGMPEYIETLSQEEKDRFDPDKK